MSSTNLIVTIALLSTIRISQAYNVKIFSDFLEANHLQHGIIINSPVCNLSHNLPLSTSEGLQQIWQSKRLSIYNVVKKDETNFEQQFYFSSPRVGIYVADAMCKLTQMKVLEQASMLNFFNNSQAWLVMTHVDYGDSALRKMSKMFEPYNLNIDADVTFGIVNENNSNTVQLYDAFKICHSCGSPLEIVYKGNWSLDNGFVLGPEFRQTFVQRRRNFQGLVLKAAAVLAEKPANLENLEHLSNNVDNKQLDFMQRKTYELLKMLEPTFNFSYDVIFSGFWGQYKNDCWNGVIGDLVYGRAMMAVSPLRFAHDRVTVITFSPVLHTEIIRFLFRHPRRVAIRNIFLEPFEEPVWWSVFSLIICSFILTWLLLRQEFQNQQEISSKIFHQLKQRRRSSENDAIAATSFSTTNNMKQTAMNLRYQPSASMLEHRLDFSMLVVLTAIFMQGPSPDAFKLISTRTLITTLCVFSVVLLQFYGAFIVGSLLSDAPRTITNMHALYNSSLNIGMENVSYNFDFFINSSNAMARDIYAQRICKNPQRNILDMKRGVERIGRGGFAYHTGVERAYRILKYQLNELEFCDLQEVAMEPPFISSVATPNGSPFKEHYANGILKLRLTGLMQYNDKKWEVKKIDCSLVRSTEVEVDIEHFVPALAFLALAMLMTLLVLFVELIINWMHKTRAGAQVQSTRKRAEEMLRTKIQSVKKLMQ